MVGTFVAIDFETADHGRDSACAVGLVRVERRRIVAREYRLIRPPRRAFRFTNIHGLTWKDVAAEPDFGEVWSSFRPLLKGATFFAAHNASFDRAVLRVCCQVAKLRMPTTRFRCTVRLARDVWSIYPTTLSAVCRALRIPLSHHHALSDAEACARIVLAAERITASPGAR